MLELGEAPLVFGREPDCDVVLDSPFVSGRHALLELRGNRYAVADLGSANPLLVNGKRIAGTYFLHSGDLVRVGDVSIEFLDERQRREATVILPFTETPEPRPGALSLSERHGAGARENGDAVTCVMVTDLANSEQIQAHRRASVHVLAVHRTLLSLEIGAAMGEEARVSHDGVVVDFGDPAAAVRCAVAIMRRLWVYNQEHPGLPLAVRIAIAGEDASAGGAGPSSAQLLTATAVVSRAAPLEILVTEHVRDGVEPLGYQVESRGSIPKPRGGPGALFAVSER